jgi:outer membrane receptor for ferrienterochelin and colicins
MGRDVADPIAGIGAHMKPAQLALTRTVLAGVTCAWLCVQGGIASAKPEVPATDDLTELSLEELLKVEIPSVVGASKYEQKADRAPSAVSVVTAEEIKRYGYLTLGDVVRAQRGFYVGSDHNYDFLGVRGFSLPGDYNSRVLMLIDGHRINDSVFQQGAVGGEFPLDVDIIDRVEIIRGPGSALYGSSAFFAVINVIPKRGKDIEGTEIAGSVANFDTQRARATFGKRWDSGLDIVLSASTYNREGSDHYVFPELADDARRNNGVLDQGDGEQWRHIFASIKYGDFTFSGANSSRRKNVSTGLYGTAFNDTGNFSTDAAQYADLQYEHAFGSGQDIFARLSYHSFDYWGHFRYADPPRLNFDSSDSKWWGGEIKYVTQVGARNRLTVGGEYLDYFQSDQKNYDEEPAFGCFDVDPPTSESCIDTRNSSKTWGIYIQDEIEVTDKLIVNAGLRYDDLYQGRTSTNPRLGLIYKLAEDTTVKALYGTAFRAPNGYELYYAAVGYRLNPGLKAEKIRTYELAIEHGFRQNLRGTASLYYYRLRDLIGQAVDPGADPNDARDDRIFFANLPSIKATGAELELQAKWTWLEGRASYSYQDVQNAATSDTLPNSPKHLVKLNLSAPLLGNKFVLGLESQYVSKRKNAQNETGTRAQSVPGYALANLTLLQRNWIKGLEISAGIYNLFDKQYLDPTSNDDDNAINGVPQPGRSFRLKLLYRF